MAITVSLIIFYNERRSNGKEPEQGIEEEVARGKGALNGCETEVLEEEELLGEDLSLFSSSLIFICCFLTMSESQFRRVIMHSKWKLVYMPGKASAMSLRWKLVSVRFEGKIEKREFSWMEGVVSEVVEWEETLIYFLLKLHSGGKEDEVELDLNLIRSWREVHREGCKGARLRDAARALDEVNGQTFYK